MIKEKIPKYPKDIFSFKDGAKLNREEINDRIQEVLGDAKKEQDKDIHYILGGDTLVLHIKSGEESEMYVCTSEGVSQVDLEDLKKVK